MGTSTTRVRAAAVSVLAAVGLAGTLLAVPAQAGTPAAVVTSVRPVAAESPVAPQAAQTLTWTAGDSTTAYTTVTTEAVAGPATIVFENSEATGNTSGMQHTLTFDTTTAGYNHDVDVDVLASPSDANGGRWELDVVLTEGTYRFFCAIPGHGQMVGELVVTGGGGGGDDTTAPTVTADVTGTTDADGAYVGAATVTLEAADEAGGSGVASVEHQLDDFGWTAYEGPLEITEIGDHTVQYRATDVAGNVSQEGIVSLSVVEGTGEDVTPPEVSAMLHGETNADGAYLGAAEVMITATDGNSGVASVEYALDGGDWTPYTEPFAVTGIGDHVVQYRATDVAGNVSEVAEQAFTVVQGAGEDDEAPVVTARVGGVMDASWRYVDAATVTLTATDSGTGVQTVEYALDDGDWTAYEDVLTVEEAGRHEVRFRATDAAGNVSQEGTAVFTVVAAAPAPACADPDPSPTVVVGTIGSGVRNRVAEGTCTVDDLILDEARWTSHAAFLAHVDDVTGDLLADGILSTAERSAIRAAADRSSVGDDVGTAAAPRVRAV